MVLGSIPGGVTAVFSMVLPTEPCALRSTQPLKVSTRDFSWGKGGWCIQLTTYHPCSAKTSRRSGALTYPEPLGPSQPVAGHLYLTFKTKDEFLISNFRRDLNIVYVLFGAHGSLVVMVLRYKPAGRGFDSRWCHQNFSVT